MEMQQNIDMLWLLIAAALVFMMQTGFTSFETGLIRAKNSINVAFKNISDFIIAVLAFWMVGFALMFGDSASGWVGQSGFFLQSISTPKEYAFFIFQLVFAGTAATIVSGAVAERMRFKGYLLTSFVITALIYPISGHWAWGEALSGGQQGWLAQLGFIDFAGATVVHAVGGGLGLVGAWMLGPRIGRFDKTGKPQSIPPHSLGTTTVGVFILWFGWFGFNGGSILMVDGSIAKIILNTLLSPAAAAVTCMAISVWFNPQHQIRVDKVLNGVIAGLVGITAGCGLVEPVGAVVIGMVSGVVVYLAEWFVLYVLRVDDPVGAVSAHGFCGIWGTLAVALFAPVELLPTGDTITQLWVQLLGVVVILSWTMLAGFALFWLLKQSGNLRVTAEEELQGLNVTEHGASTIWLDTLSSMQQVVAQGELNRRIEEEPGTEAGEMAKSFNLLLQQVNLTFEGVNQSLREAVGDEPRAQQSGRDLATLKRRIQQKAEKLVVLNEALKEDAMHDGLTGLPNRVLLMDRIEQEVAHCKREHERFALMFIDLDNFKQVNDELGHQQGDELLIEIADALKQSVRELDTTARLGGDEFVVLMHGWWDQSEVSMLADRILQQLYRSYAAESGEIVVSGSIGVALFPGDGETAEQLLSAADQAMYVAKSGGKGCCHFYQQKA